MQEYIIELNNLFEAGNATEHSYRPALKKFIDNIIIDHTQIQVVNEPKRIACGAPDLIITKNNIPACYIETKNIGIDLKSKQNREQFDRYINALDTFIITDYLTFTFYQKQQEVETIRIAEIQNDRIFSINDNFSKFSNYINAFVHAEPQTIVKSQKLAQLIAGKAKIMATVIEKILDDSNSAFHVEKNEFQEHLIKNISNADFADIYAQTITYGMFAARLQNPTTKSFTRRDAADLIPKSNPFLRGLFQYIGVHDLDSRFSWIVDDLAEAFRATDMYAIMGDLGDKDPIIHFYEYFLIEYNPSLRKNKGVYYTPNEIVNFIVKAVDDILIQDFNLPLGLADNSLVASYKLQDTSYKLRDTSYKLQVASYKLQEEIAPPSLVTNNLELVTSNLELVTNNLELVTPRVQILDPATGTGTFLVEIIKQIHQKFSSQQGIWQNYVTEHLIPSLNGFEILMAPYTMAHLNLNWILEKTGYKNEDSTRLRVFLTNSLEEFTEGARGQSKIYSSEANQAGKIKLDTPVMVVLGNPPYSGVSLNKDEWISQLINDYKYVDGAFFNEKKHWLNDDYVKFIRLGQNFVDRNETGILALITNHGFIDNPTFRGMRYSLMKSFNKIYIIDLHGNTLKKETALGGSKDENVFDIKQGVSINIFVKHSMQLERINAFPTEIYHYDLYGKRKDKFDFLLQHNLKTVPFAKVQPVAPFYFFVPKSFDNKKEYEKGFKINELMTENVTGIVTARDSLVIDIDKESLLKKINRFSDRSISDIEIRRWLFPQKTNLKYAKGDTRGWKLDEARFKIRNNNHIDFIIDINYRPFDTRKIYYSPDMVDWDRKSIMRHFMNGPNVGLMVCRQQKTSYFRHCFIHRNIVDANYVSNNTSENGFSFPLYLKPESNNGFSHPNLNIDIVKKIAKQIGLPAINHSHFFSISISDESHNLSPLNIFDYIYACLHSPTYREKYKEFLKIDFPRIPYPKNAEEFWRFVDSGKQLRKLHLMDNMSTLSHNYANFNIPGENIIENLKYQPNDKKVYINQTQYFDNVPQEAWNFYIGGYQPAQKWLKDRKDKMLSFNDVIHYQNIIKVLMLTIEEMDKLS